MRFNAYLHNLPPGADPDGGASDRYTCPTCGDSNLEQADMDPGSEQCRACTVEEKEAHTGEDQEQRQQAQQPQGWPTPADLADAAQELEVERANKAMEWQRARERVALHRGTVQCRFDLVKSYSLEVAKAPFVGELFKELDGLMAALDELERLES